MNSVLQKLPPFMQNKWIDSASNYKVQYGVMYSPFSFLVEFIDKMASRMNDPSFKIVIKKGTVPSAKQTSKSSQSQAVIKKINVQSNSSETKVKCQIQEESSKHTLMECHSFLEMSLEEKRDFIQKRGLCFKCLCGKHLAKHCKEKIKWLKCNSKGHCTPFHIQGDSNGARQHGGESSSFSDVSSKCTEVCGNGSCRGNSCAKTLLVKIYHKGNSERALKAYAIIDEQSNKSFARSELLEYFQDKSESIEYTLSSCSGKVSKTGKRAQGFVIGSLDGSCKLDCPPLLECNAIPDTKQEVATPSVARQFKHLRNIEHLIPEIDYSANILVLIGRDLLKAHHVLDQRIGREYEPYAQRLSLGWVIIGEACLGLVHQTSHVNVNKTNILYNGQESIFEPCQNIFEVNDTIFCKSADDDMIGLSREDRQFLNQIESEMSKSSTGKLSCPLPLRDGRQTLPNNYTHAKKRIDKLLASLKRDPVKQSHFLEFMENMLVKNHAELAPPVQEGQEIWYLPIFGVYHPQKPSKIRVVFDSSAKFKSVCLNDVLLKGPDLSNNLIGVLIKFRKEKFAAMADVDQMFFNFEVDKGHRDLLRFLWFKDNNLSAPIVEYRMRVHVFGNSPSPAIATYGLRKAVCPQSHGADTNCDDVCHFVNNKFYIDDALVSKQKDQDLVNLLTRTQCRLQTGGKIRLHKIVSNSSVVLASFPADDLAKDVAEIDFSTDTPYIQKSLGLSWDIVNDCFTYQVQVKERPFTKRGLLSVINGLFDPLGFVAPVVLDGRLIFRQAIQNSDLDWDDPHPGDILGDWEKWVQSLSLLKT